MSFATEGDNDQVRVRMGEKAPEFEANEIRNGSQAYRSDGLSTPQSLATIYKFTLDDGHILYLGVDTDNKFVELTSSTHPDEFGAGAGIPAVILSRSMCRRIPVIIIPIFRNDRTAPAGFRHMMITARSF
ncbi:hypothetical protein [Morganella morganii]|uniref:hypothetical protein n=1 Tax=Morganella morganii TaxID=582 RepID=UPI00339C0EE3